MVLPEPCKDAFNPERRPEGAAVSDPAPVIDPRPEAALSVSLLSASLPPDVAVPGFWGFGCAEVVQV